MIPQSHPPITHDVVDESLRAKTPNRIAGMFDAIAGRYDLLNRVLSAGLDQRWRRRAVNALRLTGRETLLDLCTGTADVALMACRRGAAARAVGVDFSHQMLRIGLREGPESGSIGRSDCAGSRRRHADPACLRIRGCRHDRLRDPKRSAARCWRAASWHGSCDEEGGWPSSSSACRGQRPIRQIYLWYSNRVLPAIGKLVSRHASAYDYLPESVSRFPAPEAFGHMLQECGFPHVEIVPLSFGIVYLYVAQR